ncbi:MAG: hypothetical protein PVI79_18220, partial [Gammaproteobacteria bacterium]
YLRIRHGIGLRDLAAVSLLRSLAIAVALFCLSRPLLEISATVPQPGVVGILLDNSISMRLAGDGKPRHAFVDRRFDAENGDLLRDLSERFDTRLFRFGAAAEPLDGIGQLDYGDGASDLGEALGFVREALDGQPLAGIVVVSDGAASAPARLESELLALRAAGTPVYPIGVGEERYDRDIELSEVSLPHRVLRGSRLLAVVTVRQSGYDRTELELRVEDDARILHKQRIRLDEPTQQFRVPLADIDGGIRQLTFSLAPQAGEAIAGNNSRTAVLAVERERRRILYFEGEPRFEFKFVRRAVADDRQLGVSGLIRTADAKYYRVGIGSQEELRNGFPTTREELFAYDALILGSVEITLLDREQQQMIVDFVSRRGGGLLLLGGRHAYSEGGYRDSPLNELFPVLLDPQAQADFSRRVKVRPTPAGLVHPALLLDENRDKSNRRWLNLPPLTIVNPVRELKPGATLLLTGNAGGEEQPYVVMAFQRFGRGKVVAFPVQNSWQWQMHEDIPLDDQSHELLWRQLLRWLVEDVSGRTQLTLSDESIYTGGRIGLRGEVLGADFNPRNDADVRALLVAPNGVERRVTLTPDPALRGIYEAEVVSAETGDYRVQIEVGLDGEIERGPEARFAVSTSGDEYYGSEMNPRLLGDIARQTGGRYFTAADSDGLAAAIAGRQKGARVLTRYELWDMPLLFGLLLSLLCAEWAYRRWRGLV